MWLAGHCDMYGGEEKWIQDFWWGKVNETDKWETHKLKVMKFVNYRSKRC